jgi:hypothetical protein
VPELDISLTSFEQHVIGGSKSMSLELTPIPGPMTIHDIKKYFYLESKKNKYIFVF